MCWSSKSWATQRSDVLGPFMSESTCRMFRVRHALIEAVGEDDDLPKISPSAALADLV